MLLFRFHKGFYQIVSIVKDAGDELRLYRASSVIVELQSPRTLKTLHLKVKNEKVCRNL